MDQQTSRDHPTEPQVQPIDTIKDYYSVLEIPKNASSQKIREAFFQLKMVYSDANQALYSLVSEDEISQTMHEIEIAYDTLSNAEKRQEYDTQLVQHELATADELISQNLPLSHNLSHLKPRLEGALSEDMSQILFSEVVGSIEPYLDSSKRNPQLPYGSVTHRRVQADSASDPQLQQQLQEMIQSRLEFDGEFFKEIRELCQVTHEEMQEHIKVSIDYIENIELNRYERLPQPVYVKGFLNSYFRYLGIRKADTLVNGYMIRLKAWLGQKDK